MNKYFSDRLSFHIIPDVMSFLYFCLKVMKPIRLLSVALLIFPLCFLAAQNSRMDSLLQALTAMPEDSAKVDLLNTLSIEFRNSSPDQSLQYATDALGLAEMLNYPKGTANSYNHIGVIYQEKGTYALAIDYHLKALKIREMLKDKKGISRSYGNMGIIYLRQENLDKALDYFMKSLAIAEELNDKIVMSHSYNNIGEIYRKKENYQLAYEYQLKSLKVREELKDRRGMAANYNNIGVIYFRQGDYPSSVKYQQFALKIQQELNDKKGIALSYVNIGDSYNRMNRPDIAIDYFTKALDISKPIGDRNSIKNAYEGLKDAYRIKNDYRRAYEFLDSFRIAKDCLQNVEISTRITGLQVQYDVEKKEKERELLMRTRDIEQKAELNKQKLIKNSFIGGFALILIMSFVLYKRYEDKKLANVQLEFQNIEINRQKEEIEQNRDQIARQKEKITDSINYAKRIQQAMLPPVEEIKKALPDSFVLFKPKDIVSGDFYWFTPVEKNGVLSYIITAADCTGHGVPGAFMSMIGTELLNQIIIERKITEPASILSHLHENLRNALKQHEQDSESKDGMDVAIINLQKESGGMKWQLQFAGAYRPLWLVKNSKLEEIKGNKFPVAGYHLAKERNFTNHSLEIEKGTAVYIFSDGFADQFGGTDGKIKFTTKRFKELLTDVQRQPMNEQEKTLNRAFEEWKGGAAQLDDILVIGIKL